MGNRRIRFLVLAGFAILFMVWWFLMATVVPLGGDMKVTVLVPKGASADGVGRVLQSKRAIRSALGFRLLAVMKGKSTSLKPGTYELKPSMTPSAVLDKIVKGEVSARWMTFPEGFTVSQMAERLEEKGVVAGRDFRDLALNRGDLFPTNFMHPGRSLEGFLFPDTYLIHMGASGEMIVREMLDCFERKVSGPLAGEIAASGMSVKEVITLASLIEREARVPEDRPLVSAVLHNRLKKGMRLECDATVLYALGGHKDRVFFRDLKVDSPYNTYRNSGLPPGPIANPGLASVEAALRPANVDYLFYVAKPDGSHIFSRTFDEHRRAIQTAREGGAR